MKVDQEITPFGNILASISDLGVRVRQERKRAGFTQAECAGLCGVGVRFLSELENGKPTLEFGRVLQVLRGLGLELTVRRRKTPWQS